MPRPRKNRYTVISQEILQEAGDLEVGDVFLLEGERYRLKSLGDESAQVVKLEKATIRVGPGLTKEIEYGVAIISLPVTTLVAKEEQ